MKLRLFLKAAPLVMAASVYLVACQTDLLPKAGELIALPQADGQADRRADVASALRQNALASAEPIVTASPLVYTAPRVIILTETPTPSQSPSQPPPPTPTPFPASTPTAPLSPVPIASRVSSPAVSMRISLKEPRELNYLYKTKLDRTAMQLTPGADQTWLETRTRCKLRFSPQPDRSLEVDIWFESQQELIYDMINGQIRNERTPTAEEGAHGTGSFKPEHFRVAYDFNGDLSHVIEPARTTARLRQALDNQISPFFSAYSPTTLRLGESWPAKNYLVGDLERLYPGIRVSNRISPSWTLSKIGSENELTYRGEISLNQNGVSLNFKENGSSRLDADTGLLKHLKATGRLETSTGARLAPIEVEIQQF